MKSTPRTTVREVSANTFRVSNTTTRSAKTGKFVVTNPANRFVRQPAASQDKNK